MTMYGSASGVIGQDAETKAIGDTSVTNFSVATKHWDHKRKEQVTEWVNCALWGDRGKKLQQHLTRGSRVTVHGEFTIRTYEHKGAQRYSVEQNVDRVVLMGQGQNRSDAAEPENNHHTNNDVDPSIGF